MPTAITVPTGQRVKSIEFGAAYSPSESFNPDKELLTAGSGVLAGLTLTIDTGPTPNEVTVAVGSFIQRGIIVKLTSPQLVQAPNPQIYPLYLVAENLNEVSSSAVQILFTQTPNADSVILANWVSAPFNVPILPRYMSNTGLRDSISAVSALEIQRDRLVAGGGQTIFTLPPAKSYEPGANKLFVFRNGKKLENINDYSEDTSVQFTINFPSLVNDIIDCIIFRGAPPITSLALLNLTDVTTALAHAVKDDSTLRVSPATQANPLATIADIAAAIGSIPPAGLSVASGEFIGFGVGDLIVPTGFTPKLVIMIGAQQVALAHGAISIGFALGTAAGQQGCILSAESDTSARVYDVYIPGKVLYIAGPIGVLVTTPASVTQMDSTQVKVTVTAGGANGRIIVLG